MNYIIDSNFLFAFKSEKDKYHSRATEILTLLEAEENNFQTNIFALNETFTLAVSRSKADSSFIEKIYEIVWGEENFFEIISLSQEEFKDIYNILKKYSTPKRLLSFVDASLIHIYQKFKANYIISFDTHFDNIIKRFY